jgi:4-hydroxyphenylacetate 3-monooxygenase
MTAEIDATTLLVEPRDAPAYEVELVRPWLVVAGYTGRDEASVEHHIRELAAHGIAPPDAVPMVWLLPNWLLRTGGRTLQVDGASTSGEVEPVLIRLPDGRLLVGVGSDHTDRDRERDSVALSKLVCPKVLSPSVWLYEDVERGWDSLQLRSRAGGDDPYQAGEAAHIRRPDELLELVDRTLGLAGDRPLVLFLGTVPMTGGALSFDEAFEATLTNPDDGRTLTCGYRSEDVRPLDPSLR